MFVEHNGKKVPVTVAKQPSLDGVLEHELFQNWLSGLDPSMDCQKIELQSVDRFSSGRIGFIKFKSTTIREGVAIPGICLLRGPAVSLLPEIIDEETNERWTVLTCQPRVPTGKIQLELPAGMVDEHGTLRGTAIRELQEECGLTAKPEELIDLTALAYGEDSPGIFTTMGLCDETMRMFLWRTKMPHDRIQELNGKLTGESAREQITLKILKFDDLWKSVPDSMTLCSLTLYENLVREGKL